MDKKLFPVRKVTAGFLVLQAWTVTLLTLNEFADFSISEVLALEIGALVSGIVAYFTPSATDEVWANGYTKDSAEPTAYYVSGVPNQSKREFGNDSVDLIICHTPEGSWNSAIQTIMNKNTEVSYHILIKEDGSRAIQFVPFSRKAWHAKVHNSRSEGISLAGFARDTRALSKGGRVMARVVAKRLKARGLPPKWRRNGGVGGGFCRHADLQTDRSDPMSLPRWFAFVILVKYEYNRGRFKRVWGRN